MSLTFSFTSLLFVTKRFILTPSFPFLLFFDADSVVFRKPIPASPDSLDAALGQFLHVEL